MLSAGAESQKNDTDTDKEQLIYCFHGLSSRIYFLFSGDPEGHTVRPNSTRIVPEYQPVTDRRKKHASHITRCSTAAINIPRQSRGYFIDGRSPLLLAARVPSRWYGPSAAWICYLLPVNGFSSSPLLAVRLPYPPLTVSLCTLLSAVCSFLPYLHSTLCTKILGFDTCTSTPDTFRRSSGCSSL